MLFLAQTEKSGPLTFNIPKSEHIHFNWTGLKVQNDTIGHALFNNFDL